MTSSAHDADLKGSNFRHTIHPQSFIAVAFIFSELDRGGFRSPPPPPPPVQKIEKKPGLDRVKQLVSVGLNNADFGGCSFESHHLQSETLLCIHLCICYFQAVFSGFFLSSVLSTLSVCCDFVRVRKTFHLEAQSRTQSPQALRSAGRRLVRLWGNRIFIEFFDWLLVEQ